MSYPTGPNSTVSFTGAETARRAISVEESDNLDKTLNILAGRAEALRERLQPVLMPSGPTAGGSAEKPPIQQASMLSDRLRGMRSIAESAITTVDDILARLDV